VEKLAEQMDKSLERIQENSLMSREIIEKLQEIQKLFEEVATPEMREAQRKLMESLKNMTPEQMQQAMKDLELSQEDLLQRLERTLALLKRMQVQAKMEAMIRKAEELLR
jgi:DNA-binding transcriptional regulator YiaG